MEHKTWYDEENELLRLAVIGPYSTKEALELGKSFNELLDGKPQRQLIVNLVEAGKMESRETRKTQNNILKEAEITDVAYVGAAAAPRMIAKVMMKLGSLNAATDFFKTDDEAISWIINQRRA
jgi:polyhydroxyalkanoate synthesis regulator phasin